MLFSVPFLIATFLVYALIPELRNIHGKSLMCYVSGLTIGYISLSISQLHDGSTIPEPACEILGYVTYSALLISFFWVNVMCIDIWLTFR
jgi:G protein-coupled receptor Mth (Methuselah protein)